MGPRTGLADDHIARDAHRRYIYVGNTYAFLEYNIFCTVVLYMYGSLRFIYSRRSFKHSLLSPNPNVQTVCVLFYRVLQFVYIQPS
jgi:hypothetical protein